MRPFVDACSMAVHQRLVGRLFGGRVRAALLLMLMALAGAALRPSWDPNMHSLRISRGAHSVVAMPQLTPHALIGRTSGLDMANGHAALSCTCRLATLS